MELTKVWINKVDFGKTKGYATLQFDNKLTVKGFRIMEGSKGLFLAMPSVKLKEPKDGKEYDDTTTMSKEFKQEVEEAVLNEFNGTTGSKKSNDMNPRQARQNASLDDVTPPWDN